MSCWKSLFGWFVNAHVHTEIPRKSSCVLGRSGVAAARPWFYGQEGFFCMAIGDIFIQQICLGSKNWKSMVIYSGKWLSCVYPGLYMYIILLYICKYIYMCICVYICICICMYIYISLSMDAVKYRRTRGLTHLDDMGMHGLYRYTLTPCLSGDAILPKCSTHRQSPHHSGSDFAQVLQNELPIFCDSNPHASRLSNTQIIRVWYVCWGWKGSQKLWVIPCISCI